MPTPIEVFDHALEHVSHLVPSQSPLDRFVHHNPLHHFEELPFEQAVLTAAEIFKNEPFWSEDAYHKELKTGRIHHDDVRWAVQREVEEEWIGGIVMRRKLVHAMLAHGFEYLGGVALAWKLTETDALTTVRSDLRPKELYRVVAEAGGDAKRAIIGLWAECERRRDKLPRRPIVDGPEGVRVRDILWYRQGRDLDSYVNPVLIRWAGGYLDHGISYWPMGERERGLLEMFLEHFSLPLDFGPPWYNVVRKVAKEYKNSKKSAAEISVEMLQRLGHPEDTWQQVVQESTLALAGWSGMFQRLIDRPDTAPIRLNLPVSLTEFVAMRLLLDVSVAEWMLRGTAGNTLLERAQNTPNLAEEVVEEDPAWTLFQVCQIIGVGSYALGRLTDTEVASLLEEVYQVTEIERRRILHLAYERRFRVEFLDAISSHAVASASIPVPRRRAQCTFCIDDREESFRRHIEEVAPWIETFGIAANYGLAIYYKGLKDGHKVSLCPAAIEPKHYVYEELVEGHRPAVRWRGLLKHYVDVGSQTMIRGTLVTLGGAFSAAPLSMQVLWPKLHARLNEWHVDGKSRLVYERTGDEKDDYGSWLGYTLEEQVQVVRSTLESMSLLQDFASLVVCYGHGSSSANNPHEAAYNCGACGGGRSKTNARLFALMANDPRVRAQLAEDGIVIPDDTWFVGAYHNTATDGTEYTDVDEVPQTHRALLDEVITAMKEASARDALERTRRFMNASLRFSPKQALNHVENRAEDFSQPRPEYNHNGNALCFVGRRAWSRNLFLDQRAFLCSYNPETDPDGRILGDLLQMAVPVGAGINLEYWFGAIDPYGYGSGTKTAHNVSGYLGVMDGHQSDLKIGLYHQMVEIHEPVRLLCVVEASPERLLQIAAERPVVKRMVTNGWVLLASLDPATGEIQYFEDGEFKVWPTTYTPLPKVSSSIEWFRGARGYLPPVQIVPAGSTK